jgi:ribokinase
MAKALEAVGCGPLNYDYLFMVDSYAVGDQQVVINSFHGSPGGSAANTINGLARLGMLTGYLGALGGDSEGKKILTAMADVGTNIEHVQKLDGEQTSKVFVFVDSQGERAMYTLVGVSNKLLIADNDIEWLRESDFVIFSPIPGDHQFAQVYRTAKQLNKDTQIVFMPGALYSKYGFQKLEEILTRTYLLILNRREISQLTGREYKDGATWLVKNGVEIVAVTLGKDGCLVCNADTCKIIPTPELPREKIVDSTGAGDAFAAGFIYGLVADKNIVEAGIYGNLSAKACMQGLGARANLLNKQTLELEFKNYEL